MFGFGRRDVADGFQQPAMVEPIDPFERGIFDGFEAPPRSSPVDHLCLVEAVDRLGQSIVVAVVDAANRRLDSSLREAFGVLDRHVLRAAVAMMDEAASMGRPSIVKGLFQSIEDETGMSRPAGPQPTISSVSIDDEGGIDEPRPDRDVSEIRHPTACSALARRTCG